MARDPLKADPSRTGMEVRRFEKEILRRTSAIEKALWELIYKEDAFGLKPENRVNSIVANTRFAFDTNPRKIKAFRKWLQEQIDAGLLTVVGGEEGKPWTAPYVESAWKKGVTRAYIDTRNGLKTTPVEGVFPGNKADFLNMAFNSPESLEKIEALATRAFDNLQGISSTISNQLNTIFANGISRGDGAYTIARNIRNSISSISRVRARVIARTEMVHAHAEGQLDSFDRLGVTEIGAMAEWSTAGDQKVCPRCAPLQGVTMSVDQARGLIPRHPNCRCAWIPAFVGEKRPAREKSLSAAIKRSVKAERPKAKLKETKERTTWPGADLI